MICNNFVYGQFFQCHAKRCFEITKFKLKFKMFFRLSCLRCFFFCRAGLNMARLSRASLELTKLSVPVCICLICFWRFQTVFDDQFSYQSYNMRSASSVVFVLCIQTIWSLWVKIQKKLMGQLEKKKQKIFTLLKTACYVKTMFCCGGQHDTICRICFHRAIYVKR